MTVFTCALLSLYFSAAVFGAELRVLAGGDLQAALDSAQPGDTILLQNGATFRGNFILPAKNGTAYITIKPLSLQGLPPEGTRVKPSNSDVLPKIVTPNPSPAIATAPGAHHYRFIGLELSPEPGNSLYVYDIVTLGSSSAQQLAEVPHDIEFDRVYLHGDSQSGSKRGIAINSASTTIRNCYFAGFRSDYQDTQAIAGWNGPGPFVIVNNYLEASGNGILFGGAAPKIQGLVPSDITFTQNYVSRPLNWKDVYPVKNLLELKNAQRVTITGNIFENNWPSAQSGFGILFTVRTCEAGDYSWAVVKDVVFSNNLLRNVHSGINILGQDTVRGDCYGEVAGQTSDIRISNNVFQNLEGNLLMILSGSRNISFDRNTAFQKGMIAYSEGAPSTGIVITNNIFPNNAYGIFTFAKGTGDTYGGMSLFMPNYVLRRNVFIGGNSNDYRGDNFFPSALSQVGMVDYANGNYALTSGSPYKGQALDGGDVGADYPAVLNATTGVESGIAPPSIPCAFTLSSPGTGLSSAAGIGSVALNANQAGCAWTITNSNAPWLTFATNSGTGSANINFTVAPNSTTIARTATPTIGGTAFTVGQSGASTPLPSRFVPITPCRIMETRSPYNFENRTGAFGPPYLSAGETRTLTLPASNVCRNIPPAAKAFVLNVTVVPNGSLDYVTVYPGGDLRPQFYTVRSLDGLVVANSSIVPAGPGGTISVYSSHATDIIIDIAGYFTSDAPTASLAFYPLTPCRVIETRAAYRQPTGPFGPSALPARQTRTFRFPGNPYCAVPAGAAAYAVTVTAVPPSPLGFLTAWAAGSFQPNVSILNAPTGRVIANSIILPANADGSVNFYTSDTTDIVVDITGYFAPDDGATGLSYYPLVQSRIVDTRINGTPLENETRRTIPISISQPSAKAYVLNATVLPAGSSMPFLSVWPSGQQQPNASVLSAFEGQTVSAGFIVPAGANGSVDVFAYRRTSLILEISGYFAR